MYHTSIHEVYYEKSYHEKKLYVTRMYIRAPFVEVSHLYFYIKILLFLLSYYCISPSHLSFLLYL